jgi:ribonucleotide reductase beta subunit family protein with ferritin-like domain
MTANTTVNTTNLLTRTDNSRFVLHPINYHDVYAMGEQAESAFWTTGEVDLSKDGKDWVSLTDNQRHFIEQVLAFFAGSDGIVIENLAARFMNEVTMPEARYFYGLQLGIETIHSKMYSLLIDTYIQDPIRRRNLLQSVVHTPCIAAKANWALRYVQGADNFATRLLAFACVEGIFFSASFAAIYYIKTLGVMPGLTQSNELIARDEGLHTEFAVLLYTRYLADQRLSTEDAHRVVLEATDCELQFVSESLPVGLVGMNAILMREYVRFVADRLLLSLGYPVIYGAVCPFDFMMNIATETKTNFFERRVSEYKRAGVPETRDFSRNDDF